jgi:tetratricopeptide (TPR) repeat protein
MKEIVLHKNQEEISEATIIKKEINEILTPTKIHFGEKIKVKRIENKAIETPLTEIVVQKEIAEFIHHKLFETSGTLYEHTIKKIEEEQPRFKKIYREIKKIKTIKELNPEEKSKKATKYLQQLPYEKQDIYIKAIYKFKEYFGSLPGDSALLSQECAGHTALVRQISELYGFEGVILNPKGHSLYGIKTGDEFLYSDIRFKNLLTKGDWEKEWKKKYGEDVSIDKTTKTNGKNYEASLHNNFGALLTYLERYEEAGEQYKEALKINPAYPSAQNNLKILFTLKTYPTLPRRV